MLLLIPLFLPMKSVGAISISDLDFLRCLWAGKRGEEDDDD